MKDKQKQLVSSQNHHNPVWRWFPALCFALLIFYFSSIPGDEIGYSYDRVASTIQMMATTPTSKPVPSSTLSATPAPTTLFPGIPLLAKVDWLKVSHGIGYFCLGLTILFALPASSRWSPSLAFVLSSLYSVSDEFHQLFVPGRSALVRDILIDTLAALGGVIVLIGIKAILNMKRQTLH